MDPEITTRRFEDETQPAQGSDETHERRVVAGRYRLDSLLGHGGHGVVWRAEDRLNGRPVAVKLLTPGPGHEPARVRREVAALRILRIPGVVRLLDEGSDQGRPFLVMDLVGGTPFPGRKRPVAWDAIAEPTMSLLRALGRIHAAGIVHRDVKPGNVLVSEDGEVTVLDFGLSLGDAIGSGLTQGSAILGTPAFLAPEQFLGNPISPQTDLYATGLMLFHALTNRIPHDKPRLSDMMRDRATTAAPSLAGVAGVPAPVALVVDALLACNPDDRPGSALEAIQMLRGATVRGDRGPRLPRTQGGTLDEAGLRALFRGEERFFHVPSDAARILSARTGGDADRVLEEITDWVDVGLARLDDGMLVVDRDALDRLEVGLGPAPRAPASYQPWELRREEHEHRSRVLAPGTSLRLWHMVLGDVAARPGGRLEVAREARVLGRRLALDGRLGQAVAIFDEALRSVRRARGHGDDGAPRPGPGEPAIDDAAQSMLLSAWVEVALTESTPRALDRVLYEICRTDPRTRAVEHLEELVRAALSLVAGGERALAAAEAVEPFADRGLERRRQGLRVLAARRTSPEREAQVMSDVERWVRMSGDPEAQAALAGWHGRLRYREGRFDESARHHGRAAALERWMTARINARLNGASALLEAFRLDEATQWAEEGHALAERCRHPYFEARAAWILRSAAYRKGDAKEPDERFATAAAAVGVLDLEALVCLGEAAVAWRSGRSALAVDLAGRAHGVWTRNAWRWGAMTARAIQLAAGATPAPGERARLVADACACDIPGIGIQTMGLVAGVADDTPRPSAAADAPTPRGGAALGQLAALARTVPRDHWGDRMDVISVEEALAALGVEPAVVDGSDA